MALWKQILIGLVCGVIAGLIFGESTAVLKPVGAIFINLIRMIIVPLIFACIVSGITGVSEPKSLGSLGRMSVAMYLLTTACAVSLGLIVALIIQPGSGAPLLKTTGTAVNPMDGGPGIVEMIVSLFPSNPITAMAEGNMLQVIVFAIFVGVAIHMSGEKGNAFRNFNDSLMEIMLQMTNIVMKIAPVGVFAIISVIAGEYGVDALLPLLKLMIAVILACLLQVLLVYGGLIRLLTQLPLKPFLRKMPDAQLMAFSTSSSAATMPVTLKVVHEKLGVSQATSNFVVPFGMTVNMDGSALNFVIATIFVAQAAHIDLTVVQYGIILFTSALISIGTAGVPGVAGSGFFITVGAVGLPIEGVALILAVDRLLDMIRTAVNVTGDGAVSLIVDKQQGRLDIEKYNSTI